MSESDSRPPDEATDAPVPPDERYAELELDEELVIYDRQNHQAWIQSDAAVETDSMA